MQIFIIADSISIHYGPYLQQFLGPGTSVQRKGDPEGFGAVEGSNPAINGGNSAQVLEYLESLLQRGLRADLLLLNCGLHDIRRAPRREGEDVVATSVADVETGRLKSSLPQSHCQIEPEQYRANLSRILQAASLFAPRRVWVRTTPVYDDLHNARMQEFRRLNADVLAYNEIADAVMTAAGVPLIDLYTFSLALGRAAVSDHVHYTAEARCLQAAYLAGALRSLLACPCPSQAL